MVSHNNNKPDFLECKDCKINFDDMAERQRHIVTEHMEKRDFPKEEEVE
jgi:hypothetical protein